MRFAPKFGLANRSFKWDRTAITHSYICAYHPARLVLSFLAHGGPDEGDYGVYADGWDVDNS